MNFSSGPPIKLNLFCSFLVFSPNLENAENNPLGLVPSGARPSIGTTLFEPLLLADCRLADLDFVDCLLADRDRLLFLLAEDFARDLASFLDLFLDFD